MDESDRNLNSALEGVDEAKRETLRRLIVKGAFVTPVVASFAMAGLTVEQAAAQTNQSTSGTFSDGRLKAVIARLATHPAGFGIYRFRYLWGENEHVGVIAQEVREVMPEAVACGADGFLRVDYKAIGVDPAPRATAA